MSPRIWLDLLKLIAGFGLLWAGFIFVPQWIPDAWVPDWVKGDLDISISIENEEKLGDFMIDLMLEESSILEDRAVDSAMWVIENRLLEQIETTDYEFSFYIIESSMVNAMTLPGGNIIVYTGLIEMAETPEEVAAVIAHELGHAQLKHVTERLVTELGMTFVMSVITGGDATLINELTHTLISGVFSRNQESEADQYALDLLEAASIEPASMATFFRRMNREQLSYDERLEWLMSHPHNNARIKSSLEYEVDESFESVPMNLDWKSIQSQLAN